MASISHDESMVMSLNLLWNNGYYARKFRDSEALSHDLKLA